ncbi:nuclear transport factor 2 family protein [Nesterenkonia alkaliphila]|uniref:DUF4440 domain-containing protein n=1 Tax=Nesterenkonia alkaliphila TaxID=1463631 RepID=A0A7K1UH84_9MICC|nr:nuclear transport factor 2 family protein [Nesterenkonia alkaliphila]MVT25756.1 DUF4440 domain-containing protein [Nesterenkonia alkaliphila]GFZ93034.1 hypothetical protein GCM10011359_23020 [Nesterenkonia alkaliphila]
MIIEELLELEHQGWQSLCSSTGADFYGQIMTEDGVMILAHGFVFSREQVIASLNDAPPWDRYEISEQRLIPLDASCAVLVYQGRAWRGESEPEFRALMSSVYVRHENTWRLACYQQTPIPPGS